jgi:hypothetical protein
MRNELSARQQAIRMRLAGDTVSMISYALRRSGAWVRKWWQRYLTAGGEGLYDLSHAHANLLHRTPSHIEQAILAIRRRLVARATPQTRYALVGAATIREELRALDYAPLPTLRTIDRVLQRANLTSPRLRLARRLPRSAYPGPQAHDSNEVHQVDLVGPRYLTGHKTKYYFLVCKDAFDQAVYAEFQAGNAMEQVLPFLVHAWQRMGLPQAAGLARSIASSAWCSAWAYSRCSFPKPNPHATGRWSILTAGSNRCCCGAPFRGPRRCDENSASC